MTDEPQHPIFGFNAFQIYTKPTERLANFILQNVEEDHHGIQPYGGGGLGKTSALEFLASHGSEWLVDANKRPIGVAERLIMPSGTRRSDRAFYLAMGHSLKLGGNSRISPHAGRDRIVNFIKTRCGQAQVPMMVLLCDNSQRITQVEYDYLADIDEQVTDAKLRLFIVFMRQSDATGVEVNDDWWSELPSHIVRRWFMATCPFTGLTGAADVIHALDRYDRYATWPHPQMSFTRYFAQDAFDGGWTLASQAGLLLDAVKALRELNRLPATEVWPMATFTLTVRYLLTNVASSQQNKFRGFTPENINDALLASGYVHLELIRARMISQPKAA
jgi:hypothetical protein